MTSVVTRRAALVGTCAAGCAAALAGCATYSAAPQPQAEPRPQGTAAPQPGAAPLVTTAEVPVGGGVIIADREIVVTQPTAGQYKAFSSVCTHQGCNVNEVTDGQIVCPCHGSYFAVADGAVTDGPARSPLPEKAITVSGDAITLA
jgi:Rieske Fe-S protein